MSLIRLAPILTAARAVPSWSRPPGTGTYRSGVPPPREDRKELSPRSAHPAAMTAATIATKHRTVLPIERAPHDTRSTCANTSTTPATTSQPRAWTARAHARPTSLDHGTIARPPASTSQTLSGHTSPAAVRLGHLRAATSPRCDHRPVRCPGVRWGPARRAAVALAAREPLLQHVAFRPAAPDLCSPRSTPLCNSTKRRSPNRSGARAPWRRGSNQHADASHCG